MFLKPLLGLAFNSRKCCHTFVNWYKLLLTGDERTLSAEAIADQESLAKQQAEQKQQQAEQKSERLAAKLRALEIDPDEA